jgi:branched-chain amino acid transport system permease protein
MPHMTAVRKFIKENNDTIVAGLALAFTMFIVIAVYLHSGEMSTTTRILAGGLYQGTLYFMVAAGLSIVFGLMDVLNFAQGSLFMIGA